MSFFCALHNVHWSAYDENVHYVLLLFIHQHTSFDSWDPGWQFCWLVIDLSLFAILYMQRYYVLFLERTSTCFFSFYSHSHSHLWDIWNTMSHLTWSQRIVLLKNAYCHQLFYTVLFRIILSFGVHYLIPTTFMAIVNSCLLLFLKWAALHRQNILLGRNL